MDPLLQKLESQLKEKKSAAETEMTIEELENFGKSLSNDEYEDFGVKLWNLAVRTSSSPLPRGFQTLTARGFPPIIIRRKNDIEL